MKILPTDVERPFRVEMAGHQSSSHKHGHHSGNNTERSFPVGTGDLHRTVRRLVQCPPDATNDYIVASNHHCGGEQQPDYEVWIVEKRMFLQNRIPPDQQPDIDKL